jgi:hypothetical protein
VRRLAPIVILGALAVAGCGGDSGLSNEEYGKQLTQIMAPVGKSFVQLQLAGLGTPSKQTLSSAMEDADSALQTASEKVSDLEPPSDAADSNADLVTALNTYENTVAETERSLSGSAGQAKAQAQAFKSDSEEFLTSLKQIKDQLASEGVKLGGKVG